MALTDKLRPYGFWQSRQGPIHRNPRALVLFSGRSREGDLSHCLAKLGWVVCSVDTILKAPTDVMDDNIWGFIVEDIRKGYFDGLWVATPCGSFSPLRENPPGPRPLRSVDRIEGLPEEQLSTQELDQLLTANILVKKSYTAIAYQNRAKKSWGLENPKHNDDKPQLWMMPEIKILAGLRGVRHADFDQCRTGLETTKPTRFLYKRMDLSKLDGLRCNHERRVLSRPDGSTYTAAHEPVVQKWVDGPRGRQRASKSQGEYTEELCGIIAGAFHSAASQEWLQEELQQESL